MSSERHARIQEAFVRVRELPPPERASFLGQLSPDVRDEVDSLLRHDLGGDAGLGAAIVDFVPKSESFWSDLVGSPDEIDPAAVDLSSLDERYSFLETIGHGGMGVVIRCHDHRLGRDVALKLPRADGGAAAVAYLRREAAICARIGHPTVVAVFDCAPADTSGPYFTMPVVEGETLADMLAAGVDRTRLLEVFLRMCEGVAAAHAKGVVHRDLKPANVMVGEFGEVAVLDWGLAKCLDEDDPLTAFSAGEGGTRGRLGTPAYMPPEQDRLGDVAVREPADVFSLGAILMEVLLGEGPFGVAASAGADARRQALEASRSRLAEMTSDHELARLVVDCLVENPDERLPDASAVVDRLNAWATGVADRVRKDDVDRATARLKRVIRRWSIAAGGVLFFLLLAWALAGVAAKNRIESAVQAYDQALWQDQLGQTDAAIASYLRALELNPSMAAAYNNLGRLYGERGRFAECIPLLTRATELQPRYATAHFNLGNAFRRLERNEEGLVPLRRAARLRPWHPAAHLELARACHMTGRYEEAQAHFRFTSLLKPEETKAWTGRSASLFNLQSWERLEDACWSVLVRVPTHSKAIVRLQMARSELGSLMDASELSRRLSDPSAFSDRASWIVRARKAGRLGVVERADLWKAIIEASTSKPILSQRFDAIEAAFDAAELPGETAVRWRERALEWLHAGVAELDARLVAAKSHLDRQLVAIEAEAWTWSAGLRARLQNARSMQGYDERDQEDLWSLSRRLSDLARSGYGDR